MSLLNLIIKIKRTLNLKTIKGTLNESPSFLAFTYLNFLKLPYHVLMEFVVSSHMAFH